METGGGKTSSGETPKQLECFCPEYKSWSGGMKLRKGEKQDLRSDLIGYRGRSRAADGKWEKLAIQSRGGEAEEKTKRVFSTAERS